jgi:cephalosporin-C deacetylase-like acetyl esterase
LSWQRFHSPRPMKQWFVSELQEALATSTHDVQMVLNYLQTRKDLDLKHIGMYGQGSGGAIAILAAAADSRITALDVTDPWGDWPDWLKGSKQIPEEERENYLKPEFLQKLTNLDPVSYLPQLKVKSLRIQQVANDSVTPPKAKDKIMAAAPEPSDVVRYPDSAAQHKAIFIGGVTEWLAQQLRSGAQIASKDQ